MTIQRKILPNQSRIRAVLIVLRISLAFYVANLVFELFRYSLWIKVLNNVSINPEQLILVERIMLLAKLLQATLLIFTAILLMLWMYRAYVNLGQFERLRYPEIMAVLGWFIPVFSWFGPWMIYSSIVRGYEEVLASQDYIRRNPRRHALKNWWWITWIAGGILFGLSFGTERFNFFSSAMAAAVFMLSNLLLISSLSDMKMMEEGIGNLKDVTQAAPASEDLLDDML